MPRRAPALYRELSAQRPGAGLQRSFDGAGLGKSLGNVGQQKMRRVDVS